MSAVCNKILSMIIHAPGGGSVDVITSGKSAWYSAPTEIDCTWHKHISIHMHRCTNCSVHTSCCPLHVDGYI